MNDFKISLNVSSSSVNSCAKQRIYIKFCVLLHKTTADTLTLLEEACAAEAMKKYKCMPCINASLLAVIASKITFATATAFSRNQKLPRDTSKGKVMLEGRTVTKQLYVKILHCLRDALRRKCPENN
ncbi:hypothetical protein C0J52_28053 [Blattella germanica]|nr:hypothetical protein C0J52_28053 [Blattella germanica]